MNYLVTAAEHHVNSQKWVYAQIVWSIVNLQLKKNEKKENN